MSDGTAADPPRGTPSRRALGAMESAVRRARERSQSAASVAPTAESTTPPTMPPMRTPPMTPPSTTPPSLSREPARFSEPEPSTDWVGPPTQWEPGPGGSDPARQRERWLIVSVAVVAVLVVVAGIALAVSAGNNGPQVAAPPTSSPTTSPPTTQPSTHHASVPPHSRHRGSAGSSSTSTTLPPAPAVAGGPPVISSITPASGAAGQGIQVAGANFLSANGQITATFNGQVAPTSCPAQNTCTVTVPPSTGATSAQIVITTASGTSNAVTFNYS